VDVYPLTHRLRARLVAALPRPSHSERMIQSNTPDRTAVAISPQGDRQTIPAPVGSHQRLQPNLCKACNSLLSNVEAQAPKANQFPIKSFVHRHHNTLKKLKAASLKGCRICILVFSVFTNETLGKVKAAKTQPEYNITVLFSRGLRGGELRWQVCLGEDTISTMIFGPTKGWFKLESDCYFLSVVNKVQRSKYHFRQVWRATTLARHQVGTAP
jgi:hypothetical protein